MLVVLTFIVALLFGYLLKSITKPKQYPPGPKWYPFVGCSAIVQKVAKEKGSQWKAMAFLAKQYSTQVLGLKLGRENLVVVYGVKNIKQAFLEPVFEGRPDSFFIRLRCLGKRMGITFADGPLWREHRQFTVKHLRNVGFGKSVMEAKIQKELMNIVGYFKENEYRSISPSEFLATSVMNILWRYIAGERINGERLKLLIDLLSARSKAFTVTGGWLNELPWCRFILPGLSGYTLLKEMNQQLSDIISEAIERHKNKLVESKDFIYSFLDEMELDKNTFSEEQLRIICLDMLIAGGQTTSNTVEFALLGALRNQDMQEKIFNEIQNVIGDDLPSWADHNRLVYTAAFLTEIQRYYTIAPMAGPRRVLEDTTIDGYFVPKETTVLIATHDLHYDHKYFENPLEFKPERFIDKDGQLVQPENFFPFGLGRRRCPGDALAKSFIFITFVGIIQKYKILPANELLPSDEPIYGLIASPKPYSAYFKSRK